MIPTATDIFPPDYGVIRALGRGGTSEVFLARRRGRQRPVALKCFSASSASYLIEQEMHIAGRIRYPGVVRVENRGTTADGRLFLQMEYCDGPILDSLAGRLTEPRLLAAVSSIASSLAVLHTAGYSHNDLKPTNIFCPAGYDTDGFPAEQRHYLKLSDFSLARPFSDAGGETITGTVGYMSPEMIARREITPTSDLFSLGVTAYYLACGVMPFGAPTDDPLEVNARISEGNRPELCGPATAFSPGIADVIRSLLAIDPRRRPQTAWAVLELLAQAGSPYPHRKAIRPRHLLRGLPALHGAALEAAFGTGSFTSRRIEQIADATAFDAPAVRLLLEHNFDLDHFALRPEGWRWKDDRPETLVWPDRLTRLSLRPLRGCPFSVKQYFLALALVGDPDQADTVALLFERPHSFFADTGESVRPHLLPMLFSLRRIMAPGTRRALSRRLADVYRHQEAHAARAGRLLFDAEMYDDAISLLMTAADTEAAKYRHDEAFALLHLALTAAEKQSDVTRQAAILLRGARLRKDLGHLPQAEEEYLRASQLAEANGYVALLAMACKELGDVYKARSNYKAGMTVLERALELYRQLGDDLEVSHTINNMGNIAWLYGRLDQALELYQNALDIQVRLQSEKDIASSLNNIGTIYAVKARYQDAVSCFQRSLEVTTRLGDKKELARSWNNLGVTYYLAGQNDQAVEAFNSSLTINRVIGSLAEQLFNIENLVESMIPAGRLNQALTYLKEGMTLAETLGEESHRSTILQLTGNLMRRMGYYGEAEANLIKALELAAPTDNRSVLMTGHLNLARFHFDVGEYEAVERHCDQAHDAAEALGDINALFQAEMIRYMNSGVEQYRLDAEARMNDSFNPRERASYYLILLERQADADNGPVGEDWITEAGRYFHSQRQDIDQARYALAVGRYLTAHGRGDEGLAHLEQALALAGKYSLLPEQWQTAAALSERMFQIGEMEKSFRYAQQTIEVLKKIAARMNNAERLNRLYGERRIVALMERVQKLRSLLAQKKGAAVGSP